MGEQNQDIDPNTLLDLKAVDPAETPKDSVVEKSGEKAQAGQGLEILTKTELLPVTSRIETRGIGSILKVKDGKIIGVDGDKEVKLLRYREVLRRVVDEPTLVMEMPRLPLGFVSMGVLEKTASMDSFGKEDGDGIHPNWNLDMWDSLNKWAVGIGFDGVEGIYDIKLGLDDLDQLMDASPLLFAGWKKSGDEFTYSFREVLEQVRVAYAMQKYTERKYKEALTDLEENLPPELLGKDTLVVVGDINRRTGGEYVGKWKEKSYLMLSSLKARDPYFDPEDRSDQLTEEDDRMSATHELFHEGHSERVSGNVFPVLDGVVKSEADVLLRVLEGGEIEEDNMALVVCEGVAVFGSLWVSNRRQEKIESSVGHDKHLVAAIEKARQGQLAIIREGLRDLSGPLASRALGTAAILRGLYKRFGFEAMPILVGHINIKDCEQIKASSPEFDLIVRDPTLLPGLEQFR